MSQRRGRIDTTRAVRGRRPAPRSLLALGLVTALLAGGCATTVAGVAQQGSPAPTVGTGTSGTATVDPSDGPSPLPSAPTEPLGPSAPTGSPGPTGPTQTSGPDASTDSAPTTETGTTDTAATGSSGAAPTDQPESSNGGVYYPTKPQQFVELAPSENTGMLIQSRTLGGYLPVPTELDPAFTKVLSLNVLPMRGGDSLSSLLEQPGATVATKLGMYGGFSTGRRAADKKNSSLILAALIFPSGDAAGKAAKALAEAGVSDDPDLPYKAVKIPNQPKGFGLQNPKSPSLQGFLASGNLVLYVWLGGERGENMTGKLPAVGKYLAALQKSTASFKPVPKDKLKTLKLDPEGVYARTLPNKKGDGTVYDGAWTGKAFMHAMGDYKADKEVFQQAKVDAVGSGRSTVYRAADHSGAALLAAQFIRDTTASDPGYSPMAAPGGLDGVSCLRNTLQAKFYCAGAIGRYAFEYSSEDSEDLKRSLQSQVAVLDD